MIVSVKQKVTQPAARMNVSVKQKVTHPSESMTVYTYFCKHDCFSQIESYTACSKHDCLHSLLQAWFFQSNRKLHSLFGINTVPCTRVTYSVFFKTDPKTYCALGLAPTVYRAKHTIQYKLYNKVRLSSLQLTENALIQVQRWRPSSRMLRTYNTQNTSHECTRDPWTVITPTTQSRSPPQTATKWKALLCRRRDDLIATEKKYLMSKETASMDESDDAVW